MVMLAANPCVHDSRILRASDVAAAAGFETIILARGSGNEPQEEKRNGVLIRRVIDARHSVGSGQSGRKRSNALTKFARQTLGWFCQSYIEVRTMERLFRDELRRLKPDLIHAHDLATLPVASRVARETRAALIYDSHELETHRFSRSGFFDRRLRAAIEHKYILSVDAVITVSGSIARYLAQRYRIALPVVVMNAPGGDRCEMRAGDLRTKLGLSADVPLAVYIGKVTWGRGLEQAVTSLRYWPEAHLALLGPSHQPTIDAIRKLVARFGLNQRVHLLRPVDPANVSTYVASADLSVIPIQNVCLSYFYSLPNKLLESTLAGLPVVVSNFSEIRAFVELSRSGVFIDETDPRDIARGMRDAYSRREELRPDRERLQNLDAIYGWPKQRAALTELYRDLTLRLQLQIDLAPRHSAILTQDGT